MYTGLQSFLHKQKSKQPWSFHDVACESLRREKLTNVNSIRLKSLSDTRHPIAKELGQLCDVCEGIGLSRENFKASDRGRFGKLVQTLVPERRNKSLGPISLIRAKIRTCSFCRLVRESIRMVSTRHLLELHVFNVFVAWELDAREVDELGHAKPLTRHLQLRQSPSDASEPLSKQVDIQFPKIVLINNGIRNSAFLGRPLQDQKEDRYGTFEDWIKQCEEQHSTCVTDKPLLRESAEDMKFYLVNLANDRLELKSFSYPLKASIKYAAVSYAWQGRHQEHLLRLDKLESWEENGLRQIRDELPQTTKNAILVARRLRVDYLWIDSLCIVHDDRNHYDRSRRETASIYGGAYVTLCAAGNETENGLPLPDPGPKFHQIIEQCGLDLSLTCHFSPEFYIQDSPWASRAWTFCERLASRRCLIFTKGRVFFECREALRSEDVWSANASPAWSVDIAASPNQIFRWIKNQACALGAYVSIVEMFTGKSIGVPSDKILAFECIALGLSPYLQASFFSGLPSSFMDVALLWKPGPLLNALLDEVSLPFPTWSWASWCGQVHYQFLSSSGVLEDPERWLHQHTWITWFIRNDDIFQEIGATGNTSVPQASAALQDPSMAREYISRGPSGAVLRVPSEDSKSGRNSSVVRQRVGTFSKKHANPKRPLMRPDLNRISMFQQVPPATQLDEDGWYTDEFFVPEHCLQFWTWSGFFTLAEGTEGTEFAILDRNGDVCGHVSTFAGSGVYISSMPYEFVAISQGLKFTEEEMPIWTYYVPKSREQSMWDIWNVLLVQTDGFGVSRRVGLGKIFEAAFDESCEPGKKWREFVLA